jgi:hypothetical protein
MDGGVWRRSVLGRYLVRSELTTTLADRTLMLGIGTWIGGDLDPTPMGCPMAATTSPTCTTGLTTRTIRTTSDLLAQSEFEGSAGSYSSISVSLQIHVFLDKFSSNISFPSHHPPTRTVIILRHPIHAIPGYHKPV